MKLGRARTFLAPLVAIMLAAISVTSMVLLEGRANGYRAAQATLADASAQFALVSVVPIDLQGRRIALKTADAEISHSEQAVQAKIVSLMETRPIPMLSVVSARVNTDFAALRGFENNVSLRLTGTTPPLTAKGSSGAARAGAPPAGALPAGATSAGATSAGATSAGATSAGATSAGAPPAVPPPAVRAMTTTLSGATRDAMHAMNNANAAYGALASKAQTEALIGIMLTVAVLLAAFLVFYRRWLKVLRLAHDDARTDALTGLGNRRALLEELEAQLPAASREEPLVLTLYDLDGFKVYNDTRGHLAGDALLRRVAEALQATLGDRGNAYRMGGDEFCSLARMGADSVDEHVELKRAVLAESGEDFDITCSAGSVVLPSEASSVRDALALADERMYDEKGFTKGDSPAAASARPAAVSEAA